MGDGGARARETRIGVAYAATAYLAWGLFPLFFRLLRGVPAPEILSHRIVWSAAFCAILVSALGRWRATWAELRAPRAIPTLAATALFISANWLTYIWAVNAGHVLEASLGYFVNPIVTVLLGVVFLRERLTRWQVASVALAAAGVLSLIVRAGHVPWIALGLAITFAMYGLLRKGLRIDALSGLLGETCLLAPLGAAYLALQGPAGHFGAGARLTALLCATGVVTALPLLWFAAGVRRLRLSTVGLLQYLNPTMQFSIAVFVFREPFDAPHAVAFGCIWIALAIYTWDAVRAARPR